jgi:hypothetical protein
VSEPPDDDRREAVVVDCRAGRSEEAGPAAGCAVAGRESDEGGAASVGGVAELGGTSSPESCEVWVTGAVTSVPTA